MPRIRTIKPEFWQNEQLAELSEHARLLAIALLNHADDKGFFVASHQLVRAACFPFEEDSKNVLGSLQDLSRIGYIEVRNCDGKQVGRICKFLDHQRIDKPQKSKLIDIFTANCDENDNSKNVPGIVLEDSGNVPRPERKGKEVERKGMEGERERNITHTHSQKDYEKQIDADLLPHWLRWCEWRRLRTGSEINAISAETILMALGRRGTEKAIRDIDFTILLNRESDRIFDSDIDFEKQQRSRQTGGKPRVELK